MALSKTVTNMINAQTVGTNNKVDSANGLDLSGAISLTIGFSVTFNASATAGARIDLFADPAGASISFTIGAYDVAMDSGDIAVSAGHIVGGNFQMQWSAKFVKVRIVNLDAAQTITNASAWATIQTP